jgi:hypothetical protein
MAVRVVAPGLSTVAGKDKGKLCCHRFTDVTGGINNAKREFLPCRPRRRTLAGSVIGPVKVVWRAVGAVWRL